MRFLVVTIVAFTISILASAATVEAADYVDPYSTNSPCGPNDRNGLLKRLIPQGWRGADFRPACRQHDTCYTTSGTNRKRCDNSFQRSLEASCANSRNPRMCRFVARAMARAVDRYGNRAYSQGQDCSFPGTLKPNHTCIFVYG